MSNVATPIEVRQLALGAEVTRGTPAVAPTKFLSLTKDSDLEFTTKPIPDPALRGYNAQFPSFPGMQEAKGPLKTPVRAQNLGEFLKMLFGSPTSTEQASFKVVTGTNDTLDFNGGGSVFAATVAAGTYVAGQTQADVGSLCQLLYAAISAADVPGTYTVTFSRTTGLFTLTRSTGIFSLLVHSGTNKAKTIAPLIGFTTAADFTVADTYTGTIVQNPPFQHVFQQGQVTQLPSYTFFINRGNFNNGAADIKQYQLGQVSKVKFSGKDDAPIDLDASLLAQLESTYAGAWTSAYNESPVLMFNQTVVKVAGSIPGTPNIPEWSIEFDPGVAPYRPLSTFQYPQDILAKGPFMGSGDMTAYFMDEVERVKFLAVSLSSLEFIATGTVINSTGGASVKNSLDILLPQVEYEAFPFGDENGFLGAKVKYKTKGLITAGSYVPLATVTLINAVPPGF